MKRCIFLEEERCPAGEEWAQGLGAGAFSQQPRELDPRGLVQMPLQLQRAAGLGVAISPFHPVDTSISIMTLMLGRGAPRSPK